MAQGQMIKGMTPSKLNKEIAVDEDGKVILSPSSTISISGGGGGGNALATYYYVQKDTTTDATYKYYGYMDASSAWVIKRINRTTNLADFVKGTSGYSAAWAARSDGVTHTYQDYGTTF